MTSLRKSGPVSVAVVEPSGNKYGSELCLLDILRGIRRERFQPCVYLPRDAAFADLLVAQGVPHVAVLPRSPLSSQRFRKNLAYLRLLAFWTRQRPSLIYVNEAGILRPISWIAKILHIPIVCQVQTLEDADWVSKNAGTHRMVSAFICNSDFVATRTCVPAGTRSVVYYGYRRKHLHRHRSAQPRAPFVVGLLGRVGGSKGHDLVLGAARLLNLAADPGFRFRFIGDAPTVEEGSHWREEVSRQSLADFIQFRGYRSDIAAELAELDLLVIPSTAEPFGRILCEAAESGCPVLLSDSGGLGELSHRFDIGLRHTARCPKSLANQLLFARTHYSTLVAAFSQAGASLIDCLDYPTYIQHIERILLAAARRQRVSSSWYGISRDVPPQS